MKLRELAESADVKVSALSNYENGTRVPSLDVQERLARALNFHVRFFQVNEGDELNAEAVSFRSVSGLSQTLKEAARACGHLAIELVRFIETKFTLPEVDLPDLQGERDPSLAAEAMRDHAGLDAGPIENLVETLEAHGIVIFSLSEDTTKVDAFSFWWDGRPFILLNTLKSPERSRFDAAHELGHLLLHRNQKPQGKEAEREADAFASAFLLDETILEEVHVAAGLHEFCQLKYRWKVSCPALVKRLHSLNRLSDWEYRDFFIQISALGGRTKELEPRMAQHERSKVLFEVMKQLSTDGVRFGDISEALGVSRSDVEGLLFQLAPASASAGGMLEDAQAPAVAGRPTLRLIR